MSLIPFCRQGLEPSISRLGFLIETQAYDAKGRSVSGSVASNLRPGALRDAGDGMGRMRQAAKPST